MKTKFLLVAIVILGIAMSSLGQETGTFTDSRDGKLYKTIKIGTQTWMSENLSAIKYNDGTMIPKKASNDAWNSCMVTANTKGMPAYCFYNNTELNNGASYGVLYNAYAVLTGKLCPAGWHVPSAKEWKTLIDYLEGPKLAGGKLKSTKFWSSPNLGASNISGFNALPSGYRGYPGLVFQGIEKYAVWWSTPTSANDLRITSLKLAFNSTEAILQTDENMSSPEEGLCVRCLQDVNPIINEPNKGSSSSKNEIENIILNSRDIFYSYQAHPNLKLVNGKYIDKKNDLCTIFVNYKMTSFSGNENEYLVTFMSGSCGNAINFEHKLIIVKNNNQIQELDHILSQSDINLDNGNLKCSDLEWEKTDSSCCPSWEIKSIYKWNGNKFELTKKEKVKTKYFNAG